MAETAIASSYTEEEVTEAARERGEPDWLVDRRAEGARAFAATPMPTPRLRPWKYTDVTALQIDAFALIEGGISVQASAPDGACARAIAGALGRPPGAPPRVHPRRGRARAPVPRTTGATRPSARTGGTRAVCW